MRRYALLFVAAVAAAGIASLVAKHIRMAAPVPAVQSVATAIVRVNIMAADVAASTTSVPVGTPIALVVTNSSPTTARLRLAGYEDRVDTGALAAGDSSRIAFVADRPGDRFAWMVDGQPRGRLDVTGSHLVEGHQ